MKFSKYHGLGNNFIMVDYKDNTDYSKLALKYCNTQVGIGADGLIAVKTNPLEMIFYNADGSRAPMCGNGIRCFAKYCYDHHLVNTSTFEVKTLAGTMIIEITSYNPFMVKVNMGTPIFTNEAIKASDNSSYFGREINIDEVKLKFYSLFMGTIHTVVFTDNLDEIIKTDIGKKLHECSLFKEKTNVNFVQLVNNKECKVKTYERGVGWTSACGTGCCATFVVCKKLGLIEDHLQCDLQYGNLIIEGDNNIFMTGPSELIAEGNILDNKGE